jgi:hypothetical protein
MLAFDGEMSSLAAAIGGYYRRYSDDILWICHPEEASCVEEELKRSLAKLGGTTRINEAKSEHSTFRQNADGRCACDRPIQYLGFTFDGTHTRIRSQTLSRFWRRLIYAARGARRAARCGPLLNLQPHRASSIKETSIANLPTLAAGI